MGFDGIHHVLDEHGDLFEVNGTFVAGGADGADEFLAVKFFAAAITFNDDDAVTQDGFGRAVTVAAFEAFAATADGGAFFADARIDDLVLDGGAFGAAHDQESDRKFLLRSCTMQNY